MEYENKRRLDEIASSCQLKKCRVELMEIEDLLGGHRSVNLSKMKHNVNMHSSKPTLFSKVEKSTDTHRLYVILTDIAHQIGCSTTVMVTSDSVTGNLQLSRCKCVECPKKKFLYEEDSMSVDTEISQASTVKLNLQRVSLNRWTNDVNLSIQACNDTVSSELDNSFVYKSKKSISRRIESDDELEDSLLYSASDSGSMWGDINIEEEERLLKGSSGSEEETVKEAKYSKASVVETVKKTKHTKASNNHNNLAKVEKPVYNDKFSSERTTSKEKLSITFVNDKCKVFHQPHETRPSKHPLKNCNKTDVLHSKISRSAERKELREQTFSLLKKEHSSSNQEVHFKNYKSKSDSKVIRLSDTRNVKINSNIVKSNEAKPQSNHVADLSNKINNDSSILAVVHSHTDLRTILNFRIPKMKRSADTEAKAKNVADIKSRLGNQLSDTEFQLAISKEEIADPVFKTNETSSERTNNVSTPEDIFSKDELTYWNQINDADMASGEQISTQDEIDLMPWPEYLPLMHTLPSRPKLRAKRTIKMPIIDQSEMFDINDPNWEFTRQREANRSSYNSVWGIHARSKFTQYLSRSGFKWRQAKLNCPTPVEDWLVEPKSDRPPLFVNELYDRRIHVLHEYYNKLVNDENSNFQQTRERLERQYAYQDESSMTAVAGINMRASKFKEIECRHANKLKEIDELRRLAYYRLIAARDEIIDVQMQMMSRRGDQFMTSGIIVDAWEVREIKEADLMFSLFNKVYSRK